MNQEEISKKYQECSTQHGLTKAKNGQTTTIEGCEKCGLYYTKQQDGFTIHSIKPSQRRLFGFKEEVEVDPKDHETLNQLAAIFSNMKSGESFEDNRIDFYNFVQKYRNLEIFHQVTIFQRSGGLKITKK